MRNQWKLKAFLATARQRRHALTLFFGEMSQPIKEQYYMHKCRFSWSQWTFVEIHKWIRGFIFIHRQEYFSAKSVRRWRILGLCHYRRHRQKKDDSLASYLPPPLSLSLSLQSSRIGADRMQPLTRQRRSHTLFLHLHACILEHSSVRAVQNSSHDCPLGQRWAWRMPNSPFGTIDRTQTAPVIWAVYFFQNG